MTESVRWGVVGTARIARSAFLPAVRQAGHRAVVVGGRDLERSRHFASENGVERAVKGYAAVIEDPEIDAVYVPLPNSLHAEWTIKALQAGKAVLCEKPLCANVDQAGAVLAAAQSAERPLWEAFVFPFHRQHERIQEIVSSGLIGSVREIYGQFHFKVDGDTNVRLSPRLGGGGLYDVGCYPIRFAQLIFGATPERGIGRAVWSERGVDVELQGVLEFPEDRRLVLSCGMRRDSGTYGKVMGDRGELRVTNPFHARGFDTLEIINESGSSIERLGSPAPSFTAALTHIGSALAEEEAPRHTALQDSLATEAAMDTLMRSAKSGRAEENPYPRTTVAPEG